MKAVIQQQYGGPQVLEIREAPTPIAGPGQVLIDVQAFGVTQGDRRLRAADYPGFSAVFGRLLTGVFRPRNPTPGTVFTGRVAAVGSGVTAFCVGDEVYGLAESGAAAEQLVVDADSAVDHLPAGCTVEDVISVPYGGMTAHLFLRDLDLQEGDEVLVLGAGGGVGRFVVQLAQHLGARVTAVDGGRNDDLLRSLGVVDILDYHHTDFRQTGARYDLVFDTVGKLSFPEVRGSLTANGRFLSVYMTLGLLFWMAWTRVFGGKRALTGVALGSQADLKEVSQLVAAGAMRSVVGHRFGFDQVVEAHAQAEPGRANGDILVEVVRPELQLAAG